MKTHDLLVIGGGVHGVSLMREAASRGLTVCLCEAADFGSGATWNSLRILHGGLRYLQGFNLPRFRQSVMARGQWRSLFPALVEPLRCVMPLDGRGFRKPLALRLALNANDQLTRFFSGERRFERSFPNGGVFSNDAKGSLPESFTARGGRGFAVWYDGLMRSPERMLVELLNDACRRGSVALNYCQVGALLHSGNLVHGVLVHDRWADVHLEIRARKVVDCTGISAGCLGSVDGAAIAPPIVAANLLLDLPLQSDTALAIYADGPGEQVFFLVPCHGYTMAGTTYAARSPGCVDPSLTPVEIELFKERLEAALPGHGIRESAVLRVLSGLLPSRPAAPTIPLAREQFYDHGRMGGVRGLFSLVGIKYTTAVAVAQRIVDQLFPDSRRPPEEALPTVEHTPILADPFAPKKYPAKTLQDLIQSVVRSESVLSFDDLVSRRTAWALPGYDTAKALISPLLDSLPERVSA